MATATVTPPIPDMNDPEAIAAWHTAKRAEDIAWLEAQCERFDRLSVEHSRLDLANRKKHPKRARRHGRVAGLAEALYETTWAILDLANGDCVTMGQGPILTRSLGMLDDLVKAAK